MLSSLNQIVVHHTTLLHIPPNGIGMADFVKLEQKHKVLDARFEVSGVD